MINFIRGLFRHESASGVLLCLAAVLALLVANSPLRPAYDTFFAIPVEIRFGDFQIAKPFLLWINDGLMALFFLLVGLELKREFLEGQMRNPRQVILPAAGAIGGMAVPAAIYAAINWGDAVALQGWAIPAATDIAFALAVLTLLGPKVPLTLRAFLVTIAVFDDVGAIVIIAVFYTENLSLLALGIAFLCLIPLWIMNRRGVADKAPYLLIGAIMWAAMVNSGVHATLTGIVLAFMIPLRQGDKSPGEELEHGLHGLVAFAVLPLFAFANSGLALGELTMDDVLHPIPLGILLGLFFGKQLGVFLPCWLVCRLGLAKLPMHMNWAHVYGAAILCGIGFTMSLFIGSLAFEETGVDLLRDERIGILLGSAMSGLYGYLFLRLLATRQPAMDSRELLGKQVVRS